METGHSFSSTKYACPSPHGQLIATVHQTKLTIRSGIDGSAVFNAQLEPSFSEGIKCSRWFNSGIDSSADCVEQYESRRFLLADQDTVHVYDLSDPRWHATISGASSNIGSISNAEFGSTKDEVLVFSDFGVKLTLWSLITSRGVEIRDPKFPAGGHSLRPKSGHLAVLTRAGTRDTILLLSADSRELLASWELPTVDARGLKWSPDGKWITAWDAASYGSALYIYTAQGHLFSTFYGRQNPEALDLGIKTVEWDPSGKWLAVGSCDGTLTLLRNGTFAPSAILQHSSTITVPNGQVWQEQVDAAQRRSYVTAHQAACPLTFSEKNALPTQNIVQAQFDISGTFLATRCDNAPSTVWIWSLRTLSLSTVLIRHHPIKTIQWHPSQPGLLLIRCAIGSPIVHLWDVKWQAPRILGIPLQKRGGKLEANWLSAARDGKPRLVIGNTSNHTIARILEEGESPALQSEMVMTATGRETPSLLGPEDMFDEGNSMDFSPVKLSTNHGTKVLRAENYPMGGDWIDGEMDDTFDFKR